MLGSRWLKEVTWKEIRDQVYSQNEKLANIIDVLNPDASHKFFFARYVFGDYLVKDGKAFFPSRTGDLELLQTIEQSHHVKEELGYSSIPLFLTLQNSNEVFIDVGTRIIPLNLFHSGSILGLFETLDSFFQTPSQPIWSVSAGARSLFMLPKLNESGGYKRLRGRFSLPSTMKLQNAYDHWQLFKELSRSVHANCDWHNHILFFGKQWFSHKNDPAWHEFYMFIFENGWNQAQFAIGKIELSLLWEIFMKALLLRRIKPSPYLSSQIKHLILIGAGKWPGFCPANDDEKIGPTRLIQNMIVEIYQLKNHLPTLMHIQPTHLSQDESIYYSLSHPTLLEGVPHDHTSATIMFNLRDIRLLLEILSATVNEHQRFNYDVIKKVKFDYFHVEKDLLNEIRSSKIIAEEDSRFLRDKQFYPELNFCHTSSFWRGCIRLIKTV